MQYIFFIKHTLPQRKPFTRGLVFFSTKSKQTFIVLWVLFLSAIHPAWPGACDTSESTDRFDINGDGTVTEIESGLTWMRCAVGQKWDGKLCKGQAKALNWSEAQQYVIELNKKGGDASRTDWRLPNLNEIATIAGLHCGPPRINIVIFPNTLPLLFWTNSSTPGNPAFAYTLSFGAQGVGSSDKSSRHYVRLVSGRR